MKFAALLLALLAFSPRAAHAAPGVPQPPVLQDTTNNGLPSILAPNLVFYAPNVYKIDASTPVDTSVILASGSGTLYGITCSSGAASSFLLPFDSATAVTKNTVGKFVGPKVFTVDAITSCTSSALCGNWVPPGGSARFTNGLAVIKEGNDYLACQVFALLDSDIKKSYHSMNGTQN